MLFLFHQVKGNASLLVMNILTHHMTYTFYFVFKYVPNASVVA